MDSLVSAAPLPGAAPVVAPSVPAPPGVSDERGATPRIGDLLVEAGLLTPVQLAEALALQRRWGTRLGDIVLARGWVRALDFHRVLATHLGVRFVDLMADPPDPALFQPADLDRYATLQAIPWRREGGVLIYAVADPSPAFDAWRLTHTAGPSGYVVTSKFDITWQLQALAREQLTDRALNALATRAPKFSARQVFTPAQRRLGWAIAIALVAGLAMAPVLTLVTINALLSTFLLLGFAFKTLLAWIGGSRDIDIKVTDAEVAALRDDDLPVYTILVPMYREPDVLPILAGALRRLDYPLSKLDIKLVLEEDDHETIDAAKRLALEATFEIIRVPPSQPKTKPKACNYALAFARGHYVTIYDAEDKPEPDQLKKAVVAFRKGGDGIACVQARLNYYNAEENWLTRMFTLEYTLWFDFFLPALESLRVPIPLGGTSNHFRADVLRSLDAWDPYNVTEDADLGVRLTQEGWRTSVVNSTTFEEANVSIPNWIRQRSRWIKGYMQTWLVHMREPVTLWRTIGPKGFLGFQLFVAGTFVSALSVPFLWATYLIWLGSHTNAFDFVFPPVLLAISLVNLLAGNGFFIWLTTLAAFKRGLYRLSPYALTVPAYWLLQSGAGYKAAWQLLTKPFYWEKTTHGLSQQVAAERAAALMPEPAAPAVLPATGTPAMAKELVSA